MSDRDDLAALIGDVAWPSSWDAQTHRAIADAILAAGWRAPEGCICERAERSRASAWQCAEHGWMQSVRPSFRDQVQA